MDEDAAIDPQPVVFRGKKRKFYRQRAEADNTVPHGDAQAGADSLSSSRAPKKTGTSTDNTTEADEAGLSVAEILRQRNARKSRIRGGVGFGSADDANGITEDEHLSMMIREEQDKAGMDAVTPAGMSKRFAAQTGMAAELVNRHM
jgi:hypothetical protein